jgi:hypothetical protein
MRQVLASRRNAHVYAHWVAACGTKTMPSRMQMQPDVIPFDLLPELPFIYIAEVLRDDAGLRFRFRLMGTSLAERLKQDATGKMLLDLEIGGWEQEWRKNLVQTVQLRLPVVDESVVVTQRDVSLHIEHLALPLSEDGETVDRIFGAIDFVGHSDAELKELIPELDWRKISSVDIAKRIVISNLRV